MQRPDTFTLNASHPLAHGLLLAGLGGLEGGAHYHDSSVRKNNGTLVSSAPANCWRFNSNLQRMVLHLNGTSEYIPFPAPVGPFTEWTIAGWVNATQLSATSTSPFIGNQGYGNTPIQLRVSSTAPTWRCYAYEPVNGFYVNNVYSATTIVAQNDYHVAFRYDGTDATSNKVFLNGRDDYASGSFTANATSTTDLTAARIGGGYSASAWFWPGTIGDVMWYNRALSPAEIATLADPSNVMLGGLIQPPRRKWWPVVSGGAPASIVPRIAHHRRLIGAA